MYPIQHKLRMTELNIRYSVCIIWFCNTVYSIVIYIYFGKVKADGKCHFKFSTDLSAKTLITSLTITHFILPLFIFIFCYIKIWIALKRHNAVHTTQPDRGLADKPRDRSTLQTVSATLYEQGTSYQRTSFPNTTQKHRKIKAMEKNIMTTLVTVSLAFFTTWMFLLMIDF